MYITIHDIFAPDESQSYRGSRYIIHCKHFSIVSHAHYCDPGTCERWAKYHLKQTFPNVDIDKIKIKYESRTNYDFLM